MLKLKCFFLIDVLVLIASVAIVLTDADEAGKCFPPYCRCVNYTLGVLVCENFTDFSSLDLCSEDAKAWSKVYINPKVPLQLNAALKLDRLRFNVGAFIHISNIASIYAYSDLFDNLNVYDRFGNRTTTSSLQLSIEDVNWSFVQKSSSKDDLEGSDTCSPSADGAKKFVFSGLNIAHLEFSDVKVDESAEPICPLIFHNSNIHELMFSGVKGEIKFKALDFDKDQTKSINTNVNIFSVDTVDKQFLDGIDETRFFNAYLLEKTQTIVVVEAKVLHIDEGILKKLEKLRRLYIGDTKNVDLAAAKPQTIFTDTKWLDFLNEKFKYEFKPNSTSLMDKKFIDENIFQLNFYDLSFLLNDEEYMCFLRKFSTSSLLVPTFSSLNTECLCNVYLIYNRFLGSNSSKELSDLLSDARYCYTIQKEKKRLCDAKINILKCNESVPEPERDKCYPPYCSCSTANQDVLTCQSFNSFKDLNFTVPTRFMYRSVKFIPSKPLQLNNDLDLTNLKFVEHASISFENIESIYAFTKALKGLKFYKKSKGNETTDGSFSLSFRKSTITINPFQTINLPEFNAYTNCQFNQETNTKYLFSGLKINILSFVESSFPNSIQICPLVFNNVVINTLSFTIVSGRIAYRNVSFPSNTANKTINAFINLLMVAASKSAFIEDLDEATLLNEYIFEDVRTINVVSTYLNYIADSTMQKLTHLRRLTLKQIRAENDKEMKVFKDTKWIENLNKRIGFDADKDVHDVFFFFENYFTLTLEDYPELLSDENICLVDKIPTNRYVFVDSINKNCTCGYYWMNRRYFFSSFYTLYTPNRECFSKVKEADLNRILNECQVEKKCGIQTSRVSSAPTTSTKSTKPVINSTVALLMPKIILYSLVMISAFLLF